MIKTIGFFGDSFCASESTQHSEEHGYESYIRQLRKHYQCEIVHLGEFGSGIWDLYISQLKPFIEKNEYPDVSVFLWSSPGRIFHRQVRNIHAGTIDRINRGEDLGNHDIWNAVLMYFDLLYDREKDVLEYVSFLQFLDNNVFSKWPVDKKIIHIWSFGKSSYANKNGEIYEVEKVKYPHRWSHGAEIRPPMMWASSTEIWPALAMPNHINGHERNKIVADCIIKAIENYTPGQIFHMNT